jgi:hypothetical protein
MTITCTVDRHEDTDARGSLRHAVEVTKADCIEIGPMRIVLSRPLVIQHPCDLVGCLVDGTTIIDGNVRFYNSTLSLWRGSQSHIAFERTGVVQGPDDNGDCLSILGRWTGHTHRCTISGGLDEGAETWGGEQGLGLCEDWAFDSCVFALQKPQPDGNGPYNLVLVGKRASVRHSLIVTNGPGDYRCPNFNCDETELSGNLIYNPCIGNSPKGGPTGDYQKRPWSTVVRPQLVVEHNLFISRLPMPANIWPLWWHSGNPAGLEVSVDLDSNVSPRADGAIVNPARGWKIGQNTPGIPRATAERVMRDAGAPGHPITVSQKHRALMRLA